MRLVGLSIPGAALIMLAACGSTPDGPVGLDTRPPASSPGQGEPGTDEPTSPPAASATESTDQSFSFTQPFLPDDEPSVIDVPRILPVEPLAGAGPDEVAAVEAVARFMASWDAILFGVDVPASGIQDTAIGVQLDRLVDYAAESEQLERVIVGGSTEVAVQSATVDGDTATVDTCLVTRGWIEFTGGQPELQPDLERSVITLTRRFDVWLANDTVEDDVSVCLG